jgi:hypothetical protein
MSVNDAAITPPEAFAEGWYEAAAKNGATDEQVANSMRALGAMMAQLTLVDPEAVATIARREVEDFAPYHVDRLARERVTGLLKRNAKVTIFVSKRVFNPLAAMIGAVLGALAGLWIMAGYEKSVMVYQAAGQATAEVDFFIHKVVIVVLLTTIGLLTGGHLFARKISEPVNADFDINFDAKKGGML